MSLTDEIASRASFDEAVRLAVSGVKSMKPTYDWVGVYLLEGETLTLRKEHYLGKPTPHSRIPLEEGLCGAAARAREPIVVDDVHQDGRYIACSLSVESEIVVPIIDGTKVIGVLDLDSDTPAAFEDEDRRQLEAVAAALARSWQQHHSSQ